MSQKQTPAQRPTRVEEFTTHLTQTVYSPCSQSPAYLFTATAKAAQGSGDEAKPRLLQQINLDVVYISLPLLQTMPVSIVLDSLSLESRAQV